MFPAGDTRFRARMLRLPSGISVRVVECGDEAAPPVLLYPGWGCSAYTFRFMLPGLAAAGFRAITVDLKGHGLSDKPLGERDYTREALVAHCVEILDALALRNPVIGGHSLGAVLSMLVATERPKSVRGLLLYSPVGYRGLRSLRFYRAWVPRLVRPLLPYVAWRWITWIMLRIAYGSIGKPVRRDVDEYWAPTQFPAFTIGVRDQLHQLDFGERAPVPLASVPHPALVMFGTEDRLLDERVIAADAAAMPNARVEPIRGAGHVICEETPEVVLEATLRFLRSL